MKKIIYFLILSIITLFTINVDAKTTTFYEGDYAGNIYMNKSPGTDHSIIYFQRARFFNESNGTYSYCVQPEVFFNENATYYSNNNISNLNESQKERIKRIAYFGYGYPNHTDIKWYAITQYMIWKEADPNGVYYFTDTLNGNKVNLFTQEMNEINNLIGDFEKNISFNGNTYEMIEGKELVIEDTKNVLSNYKSSIGTIKDNKLTVDNLPEGLYTIKLVRLNRIYNRSPEYYEAEDSQNQIIPGDISKLNNVKVKVVNPTITIYKTDKDTNSIKNDTYTVVGTKYKVLDENDQIIGTIEINEEGFGYIDKLDYGKYKIIEDEVTEGYQLDETVYEVELNKDNLKQTLNLENELIKKEVEIHKTYDEEEQIDEEGVVFEIYDEEEEILDTIETDEEGKTNTTLPYGTYTIKQKNTKDGYSKVDTITIKVTNTDKEIIELVDYKIKVPNTYNKRLIERIIELLIRLL